MKFENAMAALQLEEKGEAVQAGWQQSQQEMPVNIPFLEPGFVRWACGQVYVPEEMAEAAAQMAERIAGSEALRRLAWHMHYGLYRARSAGWEDVCSWPALAAALGSAAGLFYLVVLVSNVPEMQRVHEEHRVPPEIVRDTLMDVKNWVGAKREQGAWGPGPVNIAWLQSHLRGDIYRLRRLQFQFGHFWGKLRAFRHRQSRVVVALAEEGMQYTGDGRVPSSREQAETWTASLVFNGEEAIGYPILPNGYAAREEVRLPLREWEQVLGKGDPAVNVHIPGGSRMSHAECGESFRMAIEFFPRHFPAYQWAAFCCGSWILNTWLEEVLPSDSNLVRFQRELYLFPTSQWPDSMLHRVFGEGPLDPATAPRDTGLRRAIVSALEHGHDLRGGGGGMFLFPQDFRWGQEVYRRQEWPWS